MNKQKLKLKHNLLCVVPMSSILAGERLQLVVDAHEVAGAGSGVVGQHTLRKVFSFPSEYNSFFIKNLLAFLAALPWLQSTSGDLLPITNLTRREFELLVKISRNVHFCSCSSEVHLHNASSSFLPQHIDRKQYSRPGRGCRCQPHISRAPPHSPPQPSLLFCPPPALL